jgi:hypothetical protein
MAIVAAQTIAAGVRSLVEKDIRGIGRELRLKKGGGCDPTVDLACSQCETAQMKRYRRGCLRDLIYIGQRSREVSTPLVPD